MEWSDDIINQLRALWAEGHSTAEIGRRLGVTKNAIVGKAHRLDLPARPSPIRRDPDAAPVRRATVRRVEGPTLPPLPSAVAEGDCGMPGFGQGAMTHGLVTPVNGTPGHMMPGHMMPGQGTPGHGTAGHGTAGHGTAGHGTPGHAVSALAMPGTVIQGHAGGVAAPLPPRPPVMARPIVAPPPIPRPVVQAPRPAAPPPPRPVAVAPRPYGRIVTCCWPIGEPGTREFRFCDVPSEPGRPYCEEHVKVAYVKVRDRREDAA